MPAPEITPVQITTPRRRAIPVTDLVGLEQLLKPVEAARLARVTPRTIYNWIHDGKVEVRLTAGGRVRVVAASLFVDIAAGAAEPREA